MNKLYLWSPERIKTTKIVWDSSSIWALSPKASDIPPAAHVSKELIDKNSSVLSAEWTNSPTNNSSMVMLTSQAESYSTMQILKIWEKDQNSSTDNRLQLL